ncbi:hypothetical protein AB205_0088590 [Aquarana catesbeiana]|uniref:Uncharacterized protein n=1 Tax=Aquarana catesbeiana TaxID=8400 RepID=A0A2G9SAY2_AQUCT|nr:hypothetical protein AB205_0088590 [Aquarana catesbeiana]
MLTVHLSVLEFSFLFGNVLHRAAKKKKKLHLLSHCRMVFFDMRLNSQIVLCVASIKVCSISGSPLAAMLRFTSGNHSGPFFH